MNCHIIELPSRPRYGADLVKSLDALGFSPSLYPGVDGRDASAAVDFPIVHPYRFEKRYGRKPVPGEIGCFASHRNFCLDALAGNVAPICSNKYPDWWFLLEDDAVADGGMNAEFLNSILERADAESMDYAFLHPGRLSRRKRLAPGLSVGGRGEIFTHASLIHRRAAESIVKWEMYDPIDLAISHNKWFKIGVLAGPNTFLQRPRREEVDAIHFEKRRPVASSRPGAGVIIADCRCSQKRGLGNLITVVCSAYAAAKVRGWETVIWWEPTTHCSAEWEQLFEPIPGIEIVRNRPSSGHRHTGAYYDAKTRGIHRESAGPGRHTPEYWQAWREIGPMIRLIPELALPEVPGFDAVSVRLAHPPQAITDAWAKVLPDIKAPFLAVDCREAFEIARRRFPDAWWLCDRFQPSDAAPRKIDHIRDAARDMVMLTRASRMFTVGRESTFRNLAHLGHGVPVLKSYAGPAP